MGTETFPRSPLPIKALTQMGKPKHTVDPDCLHLEYAKERSVFGGQRSGDYECLRCGFTWDPNNPPADLEEK